MPDEDISTASILMPCVGFRSLAISCSKLASAYVEKVTKVLPPTLL